MVSSSPAVEGPCGSCKSGELTYVTGTVLPQVQANIAFVLLALGSLIFFLLWRLFRRCCMCCCMRQSCEEQRNQADPAKILSGWRYWLQKIVLLVFAVAALAMLLAADGIILAPKELFGKVWRPVNRLNGHLNNTAADMDVLISGLDSVYSIMDNLTSIVNNDVRLSYIRSNLQAIGVTLDSSNADPNTLVTALSDVDTSVTSVRTQAGLPGLSTVVSVCNNYSTRLDNLNTELASLNAATGPTYGTASLTSAMDAVEVDNFRSALGAMLGSLDAWISLQTGSTLSNLATSITTLSNTIDTLKGTQMLVRLSRLNIFLSRMAFPLDPLDPALLDHIAYVQANVAKLDDASNAVVQKLTNVYGSIANLTALTPPPTGLASSLTALVGQLSLGPATTLVNDLNNAQTAIDAVPLATLNDARTTLGNLKSSLDSLSPKHAATNSAIATYTNSATQANFDAMKASAVAAGNTWDLSKTAKSSYPRGHAPSRLGPGGQTDADTAASSTSVAAVQTAASTGNLDSAASNVKTGATSVDSAAASTDGAIASLPAMGPYSRLTASVKSVYDSMPNPKSKELNAISSTLNTVENLLVSVPANVKSQTSSIQSSFGDGVDKLRKQVIKKVGDFEHDNEGKVDDLDLARYRAACAVLGVAAFVVVVLIVVVIINCPWGIGCAIFFLLLLAALLFLLAVVFALVLVVAQDGCHHTEHVVIEALGAKSTVRPLADYYFFGSNSTSIKAVLKNATLVDIDKVEQKVVDLADGMINDFTAKFTPQRKLSIVITDVRTFINTTLDRASDPALTRGRWVQDRGGQKYIDALLEKASVAEVRPLYIGLKSYPCCDITDYSFKMWVVLTFGGWLMFISASMSMGFLGRLDQLPQSGCCGCKPLVGKGLKSKVHPETEGDEEGATKAVMVAPARDALRKPASANCLGGFATFLLLGQGDAMPPRGLKASAG
ncbi:hypothetical protein VOLCADRAFT_104224 [Volvox carteri f. nagariensis]|uniref:Uncharacterized protein n=1 Tax=Volvox carteri f. nagariensis TaxID=3068 RepID=D8TS76_VOLCA|nr:uncharacterized protein VOLCADRAFT_104224 [Volvox carteri f. nagariensis]EFJ49777.1 hypothetical protein VOLCADRAFT_104224 [Volvox carteri f. nagariensis]|eukprot:XP_002949284.1 hypothetical protein VOLCADRAFT_104224 [Volvox carteri f. nagariensis]